MKRNAIHLQPIALLIVMVVMLLSAKNVFAQKPIVEATYTTHQDYSLRYENHPGALDCTVEATFISISPANFLVKVTRQDRNDSINLSFNYPLNYEYFYSIITKALQSKYGIDNRFLNEDINAIYNQLFLLTIVKDYDDVNSGTLYLNRWAMVMQGNRSAYRNSYDDDQYSKDLGNTIDREGKLDSVGNTTFILDKSVASLAVRTNQLLDSVILLKTGIQEYISDTSRKSEYLRIADSQLAQQRRVVVDEQRKFSNLLGDSITTQSKIDRIQTILDSLDKITNPDTSVTSYKNAQVSLQDELKNKINAGAIQLSRSSVETEKGKENNLNNALNAARDSLDNSRERFLVKYKSEIEFITEINQGKHFLASNMIDSLSIYIGKLDSKDDLYSKLKNTVATYKEDYNKLTDIKKTVRDLNIYKIKDISLQFERGYLERIQVTVEKGYSKYIFENIYAIGMSSIYNFKQFSNIKLYIRKSRNVSGDYIYLSDVMQNYQNLLDLYTRDYSPADTVINNIDPAVQPAILLRKEKLINLFDARIYTDLVGLRADQPNGLVQIEVCKRFNLITQRAQMVRADVGIFNSLNIYGGISKIEENLRSLTLRNAGVAENNKLISPYYATGLDFRQYENLHFGADINLLLFDYPDGKFTFYVDMGYRYGHTNVIDSNYTVHSDQSVTFTDRVNNLDAHTLTWELVKLRLELFSERRLGLTIGYQYNVATLYSNNQFKQIVSYDKSAVDNRWLEPNAGKYHIFDMNVRLETSRTGNGRLFLRGRYFFQKGDVQSFFAQLQVGYAYNLIFRK